MNRIQFGAAPETLTQLDRVSQQFKEKALTYAVPEETESDDSFEAQSAADCRKAHQDEMAELLDDYNTTFAKAVKLDQHTQSIVEEALSGDLRQERRNAYDILVQEFDRTYEKLAEHLNKLTEQLQKTLMMGGRWTDWENSVEMLGKNPNLTRHPQKPEVESADLNHQWFHLLGQAAQLIAMSPEEKQAMVMQQMAMMRQMGMAAGDDEDDQSVMVMPQQSPGAPAKAPEPEFRPGTYL